MIIALSSEWLATNHDSDFITRAKPPDESPGQRRGGLTCRLYGTDLLRCSLFSFCWREKLRHDFALKLLHESSDVPVDERAAPASFVVTISGMLVWSCNEFLLIFTRLKYGIYSDFLWLHTHTWNFYCLQTKSVLYRFTTIIIMGSIV